MTSVHPTRIAAHNVTDVCVCVSPWQAWRGKEALSEQSGKGDAYIVGLQSARCFFARKYDCDVYYESAHHVPARLAGCSVTILECPSEDWRRFLPTDVVFATVDAFVTKYVKGGTNKSVTNHRARGGTKVGSPSHLLVHTISL